MHDTTFYPLEISDITDLTDSAKCFSFKLQDDLKDIFKFIQGQFVTLKTEVNDETLRRSYSICSSIQDEDLKIAIKRVNLGKFSNYANDHFKVGDTVDVMPPQGNFYTQLNPENCKKYMCIAVGSGITPILSIITSIFAVEPKSQITLIYGNRRSNSMMFRNELSFIKNKYMHRFTWLNIMTQEDQGCDLLKGTIDNKKGAALHKNKLINIVTSDDVFICGPESMMSEVSRGFRMSGFEESRIHYELFSTSFTDSQEILKKSQQRIEAYGEQKTASVTIIADGRSIEFDLATVGENILDAGIHHGMELPYSCKAGVCSTCKAKLTTGKVDMDITHGLEPHEIEQGLILTCQAHPVSEKIVVDFDNR